MENSDVVCGGCAVSVTTSLRCPFNRCNTLRKFGSDVCVCVFYVCEVIGFVD